MLWMAGRSAPGPDRAGRLSRSRWDSSRLDGAPAAGAWLGRLRPPAGATAGATGWPTCGAGWRRPWCRRWRWPSDLRRCCCSPWRAATCSTAGRRVPADAPNRFVINIQPDQRAAIADFFKARGLPPPAGTDGAGPPGAGEWHARSGRESYADDRAQRLVDREFNLSWSAQLPAGNSVTAAAGTAARRHAEFSVEQGLAETLNLKLGDRLVYEIAGNRVEAIDHQPAQARLGFDAGQFLRHVAAGRAGNFPGQLHHQLPPAGRQGGCDPGTGAYLSQPDCDRCGGAGQATACDDRPGVARRATRVRLCRAGRAGRPLCGSAGEQRRAPP
jgi:hypothetical protein